MGPWANTRDRGGTTAAQAAADLLWTGFVLLLIAGFVLRMWTRPEGKRPFTIDLSRRRS